MLPRYETIKMAFEIAAPSMTAQTMLKTALEGNPFDFRPHTEFPDFMIAGSLAALFSYQRSMQAMLVDLSPALTAPDLCEAEIAVSSMFTLLTGRPAHAAKARHDRNITDKPRQHSLHQDHPCNALHWALEGRGLAYMPGIHSALELARSRPSPGEIKHTSKNQLILFGGGFAHDLFHSEIDLMPAEERFVAYVHG